MIQKIFHTSRHNHVYKETWDMRAVWIPKDWTWYQASGASGAIRRAMGWASLMMARPMAR